VHVLLILRYWDQKNLHLSKFLVFEGIDTLWQTNINGSEKRQHKRSAFGAFMGGFDLHRGQFNTIHALCLNRETVTNCAFKMFVRSISEIHKGLLVTETVICADYDSILMLLPYAQEAE